METPCRLSDFLQAKRLSSISTQRTIRLAAPGRPVPSGASYKKFKAQDIVVIGISKDSVASHLKFAQKYDLPFILLSDPELQAIQAYGVWQEKKLYGKVSMGVVRTTFLIDERGYVEKVMPKVKPDTNAAEILAYLAGEQYSHADHHFSSQENERGYGQLSISGSSGISDKHRGTVPGNAEHVL